MPSLSDNTYYKKYSSVLRTKGAALTLHQAHSIIKQAKTTARPVLLVLENTKNLNKEILHAMQNQNIRLRVCGGLNEQKNNKYATTEYMARSTYTPEILAAIVEQFEAMEKGINPQWSDLSKALYVYKSLASRIHYDGRNGEDSRNLSGIDSRRSVCSGYALIFKEAMDRIGIPCRYINKPHSHSWNAIKINNKWYNIDLTWDSVKYHEQGSLYLERFGRDKNFSNHDLHQPDSSEYPLPSDNNIFSQDELKAAVSEIKNNPNCTEKQIKTNANNMIFNLPDGRRLKILPLRSHEFQGIKQYACFDLSKHNQGQKANGKIFYTEEDLTKASTKQIALLFSKENLKNADKRGGYLGKISTGKIIFNTHLAFACYKKAHSK